MDINKSFYKTIFKNLFTDPCTVKYWDGDEESYGTGSSKFKLILNEPISKADFINDPSMTFGEGYMFKKIELEGQLQQVVESLFNNSDSFLNKGNLLGKAIKVIANNTKKSKENVEHHYDIGNDFYKLWLDDTMTYSCGYFKTEEDTLLEAQKNKVDHILKKLSLSEGQSLLDIGCGWGELIITAAKKYKVKAMGITLSSEQFAKVKERIESEGLKDMVDVKLIDYRELKDMKFDRVLSVGMAEHLGKKNINEYFEKVNNLLNTGGLSLLHTITGIGEDGTNSWVNKYIFPGGYIPNVKELITGIVDNHFNLLDAESLRVHYAMTLEHWAKNFEKALPEISKSKDEVFIRMWRLYLNTFAANFRTGNIDIHQFLFVKGINTQLPLTRHHLYL
jgi:cyclopropane-fatty-acyl-phospholipid synthase